MRAQAIQDDLPTLIALKQEEGLSFRALARRTHVSHETLRRAFRQQGLSTKMAAKPFEPFEPVIKPNVRMVDRWQNLSLWFAEQLGIADGRTPLVDPTPEFKNFISRIINLQVDGKNFFKPSVQQHLSSHYLEGGKASITQRGSLVTAKKRFIKAARSIEPELEQFILVNCLR